MGVSLSRGRLMADEHPTFRSAAREKVLAGASQLADAVRDTLGPRSIPVLGGAAAEIEAGVRRIRPEINRTTSDDDREMLEERLAELSGGVAVVRVGAPTEAEMKARSDALDGAVRATRAAVAEGIAAGGGLSLLRCMVAVVHQRPAGDAGVGEMAI